MDFLEYLENNKKEAHNRIDYFKRIVVQKYKEDGLNVFNFLHETIDELSDKTQQAKPFSCTSACNSCCHDTIIVSPLEAQYIIATAIMEGVKVDRTYLKEQSKVDRLKDLKWAKRKCMFNDKNGNCMVYNYRPMICRTHNSIDDPKLCYNPRGNKSHGQAFEITSHLLMMALVVAFGETTLHEEIKKQSGNL